MLRLSMLAFQAQPRHLSCIAVSAFHLACKQYRQLQQEKQSLATPGVEAGVMGLINIPEPADLVSISQSRCSPSDLLRMQKILQSKLEVNPGAGPESPITALTFLHLMYSVSKAAAIQLGLEDLFPTEERQQGDQQPPSYHQQQAEAVGTSGSASTFEPPEALVHQLEILACDSMTLNFRPCEVALALLTTDFQRKSASKEFYSGALMGFISELQKYCNVSMIRLRLRLVHPQSSFP